MWPQLNDYAVGIGQLLLAALFFILAIRLLFGHRLNLSMPDRRPAADVEAPPARLAAAFQPLQAAAVLDADRTASDLTATWIAEGASTLERQEPPASVEPPPPAVWSAPPSADDAAGHQENVEELLRWGQQAARAGDRLVAYRLFARAMEVDPSNEAAWLWRAATCDRSEEAIRCLEQVLLINPNNERARRGLGEARRRLAGL